MKIAIDGNEANEVRTGIKGRVGVNNYAFKLLRELHFLLTDNKDLEFTIFLKNKPGKDMPPEKDGWKYKVLPGRGAWILRKLTPHLIFREKFDVFFTPNHYLPFVPNLPKICTIHDLGYLVFSGQFSKIQYWQLKYWSANSIYVSKCIITPSEFTKKDIVRHYKVSPNKIISIHHGLDVSGLLKNTKDTVVRHTLEKFGISKDYVIFVGALKPSKNLEGLIDAFALLHESYPNLELVIAGPKGWMFEKIFEKVKKYNLTDKVLFTGFISDEDKYLLIKNAKAFLLVSFWEGFGMDVVNALYLGTPVVLSKIGSLREVAGSAGIYVDPNTSESIKNGIKEVLEMPKLEYNKLIETGKKVATQYSWKKSAMKTLGEIRNAALRS